MRRVCAIALLVLLAGACGDSGGPALTPTTLATILPAPDTCTLGVPTELKALVTDVNGSPVPGVGVTFTVDIWAGTVSPPTSMTNADGIAATVLTCAPPVVPGPFVVEASFEGVQQNNARWALTTRAGTLALIDFSVFSRADSMPVAAEFTQPLTLLGLLRDGFGGSPTATVTWEVISGGGSLSQHSTEPFDCSGLPGTAGLLKAWCVSNTWTLGANGPGVHAIRLSSPGSPDFEQRFHARVMAGAFTIIREPASDLSGEAGSVLPTPLAVRVLAADGSPIPRVVVRFGVFGHVEPVNPADTAFNSSQVYTDLNGRATMRYTFPTKADGLTYGNVATPLIIAEDGENPRAGWSLFVLSGPPVQLRLGSGNDQSGSVGQPLGNPLGVLVEDQFGNIVGAQSVTWTVTSGGGSLAESTTVSDEIGRHQNIWTLGPTPGVQTAAASFGGMTVTFTAHAGSGS